MMSNRISLQNIKDSDIAIEVDTDGTSLLDIQNVDYCFESGYKMAMRYMDKIKKILE